MTLPVVTLRMDLTGTTFGSAPTWSDQSAYLLADHSTSVTWGRQDEQAEVQPSTCSFTLDNHDGRWTPGNASASAHWDVGTRVNVRVTVGGTVYDRFDGYVDSIEPSWPGGGQSWSQVQVTCTDVSARLAIGAPLRSMVQQEMLGSVPVWIFPLGDPTPSGLSTADIVGTGQIPTLVNTTSKYGAGTLTFGAQTDLIDGQTGVEFDSPNAGGNVVGAPVTILSRKVPRGSVMMPVAGLDYTSEVWFRVSEIPAQGYVIAGQFSADGSVYSRWDIANTTGQLFFAVSDGGTNALGAYTAGSVCDGRWHHAVGVVAASRLTATLFVDGRAVSGTIAAGSPVDLSALQFTTVGGSVETGGNPYSVQALKGAVALFAHYNYALSYLQAAANYQAGTGTLVESAGDRYDRLGRYANLTFSGVPAGSAIMGGQNTAGESLISALAKVARTEGTVSYVTGAGALTFQNRATRYNAGVGLTVAATEVNADATVRRDRQGMLNEITASRDNAAAQHVVDAASQAAVGRFDGGSFDVAPSTDYAALQLAAWKVATEKTPQTRLPNITVDLLTQPSSVIVAAALNATISTLMQVTSLPSQAPAGTLSVFVEGGTETISVSDWSIQFFTSPNLPVPTLRADASPDFFTRLDAGLKIPL